MRRHLKVFTRLPKAALSVSATIALIVLMSPLLVAADRPAPLPSAETNGSAPSEPALEPRVPPGRRAPSGLQNSGQAERAPTDLPVKPPIIVLDTSDAAGILSRPVRSAADENMGRVIDIIVDRTGSPRAAVIDFGGFLGVGSRKIAVDWNALRFATPKDEHNRITLEFTRDQVKAAPEYQQGKPVTVLGAINGFDGSRLSLAAPEH